MPAAARMTDTHMCPMVTGVVPHGAMPIISGQPTVLIGNMPAARMNDMVSCLGPPATISLGAVTTLIGNQPAARMGDISSHGGNILLGCVTVMVN